MSKFRRWRIQIILSIVFVIVTANTMLYNLNISKIPTDSLAGICPVNGLNMMYILFTSLNVVSFITLGILLMSFLFGSVFCGWVCPLGAFQDLLSKLAGWLKIKNYNKMIPKKVDKKLRLLRYIVLLIVLFTIVNRLIHLMGGFCIYSFIVGLLTKSIAYGGLAVLLGIFLASLFTVERPFCKYLCPYGAFLGFFNKFRLFKLSRKESTCINCKKCDKNCPMNIEISKKLVVSDNQCISCMKCTSEDGCPVKDTVIFENRLTANSNLKKKTLGIVILIVVTVSLLLGVVNNFILYGGFDGYDDSYEDNSLQTSESQLSEENLAKLQDEQGENQDLESYKEEDNQIKEESIRKIYLDGEYEGFGVGYRPGLRVKVSVFEDKIKDVEILSHRETRGYYEESFELIPSQIIERQSTDVDSISGATDTVDGIVSAVENALRKAKID